MRPIVPILSFGVAAIVVSVFFGAPSAVPAAVAASKAGKAVATGYWGAPTAVHQFCEPKYASSWFFAELYNALSSLTIVMVAANALRKTEMRRDPMMVISCLMTALIGVGSFAFHGTMLFEYELCDEVPMLLFIAVALCNKIGAHPWLMSRTSGGAFAAAVAVATVGLTAAYVKFQVYELFVVGFTLLLVLDTVVALTWSSQQRVTSFGLYASVGFIIVAKVLWEIEVRVCSTDGRVWPLHVAWHVLSAASLYYGMFADMANRIDCGLSGACEGRRAVPIDWAFVPYSEVKVLNAPETSGKRA